MTEDQTERLIAAVERIAANGDEEREFRRQMRERLQQGPMPGPPPEVLEHMGKTPPEMMRMIEALEGIAAGLRTGK